MFEIGDTSVGDFFMEHNIRPDIAGDICAKIILKQRQEASKWMKEFKSKLFDLHLISDGNFGCKINREAAIKLDELQYEFLNFWKERFNLTEEDLK